MLDRYVGWVETFRETHLAFVRGAAGGDPWVSEVYEETRARLVDVALEALDLPDDARRRQLVLAWFAFTEDLVGQWAREPTMSRDELLALLRDVLERLTARRSTGQRRRCAVGGLLRRGLQLGDHLRRAGAGGVHRLLHLRAVDVDVLLLRQRHDLVHDLVGDGPLDEAVTREALVAREVQRLAEPDVTRVSFLPNGSFRLV